MTPEKDPTPTKQSNLYNWTNGVKPVPSIPTERSLDDQISKTQNKKPRLAFGFGFDSKTLKNGILRYSYSHELKDGIKLYEFEPKLSYRIFNVLAKILNYKCTESELRDKRTVIKNKYFLTDQDPEIIVQKLNKGIKLIFENYEPSN